MSVEDYSTTPSSNTTISGINIAEGCAPAGINNAIRQMMADIRAFRNRTDNPHSVTASQAGAPTTTAFNLHTGNTSNPHNVTAAQVGAPTTATFNAHKNATNNPHSVTISQVGGQPTSNPSFTNTLSAGDRGTSDGDTGVSLVGTAGRVDVTRDGTSAESQFRFFRNGNQVGSIVTDETSTSYNNFSDYRLKNPLTAPAGFSASAKVKSLADLLRWYSWKSSPTVEDFGWYAHELQEVCPKAVTGEKDAVDGAGNILPQGRDDSKLIPILVAALADALSRIQTLEEGH